jgi:predicted nucleotidyltransferase
MPQEYYYGLKNFEQQEIKEPDDTVIYSINKFFKLAIDNNPNILEIIFSDPSKIIQMNDYGKRIYDIRYEFLSKRVMRTYSGYSFQQLKRMKNHKKWLDNPIDKPLRENYGLPHQPKYPFHIIRGFLGVKFEELIPETAEYITKELKYLEDKKKYDDYKKWLDNRNPQRFAMESTFGYDGKHASHLIRLLKTGIEILRDGELHVLRPDAKELTDIRNGSLTYDELMKYSELLDKQLKKVYDNSKLPDKPNFNRLNGILIEIIRDYHKNIGGF